MRQALAGLFLVALLLAPGGASQGSLAPGPIGMTRLLALEVDNHSQARGLASNVTQTAPASVLALFIVVGVIIFAGFFATQMFYRTKVPDLLVLIGVGLLLGPVNAAFIHYPPALQLFNRDYLRTITPLFAALALMIILFDGGLNLNFDTVLRNFKISTVHTMVGFLLTMAGVAIVATLVLGYPPLLGLLLGCIVGGISGAIVVSLVKDMTIGEGAKVILALEAVLTDVLVIIGAISIIRVIEAGGAGGDAALGSLLTGFSVATVIGVIFGLVWLKVLTRMHGRPYSFMITVAALFVLYAVVEMAGSSGAMASLVFGVVLGNHEEFARMFKMKTKAVFDEKIRQFHMELSFVVRTFFFVFLGLVFTFRIDDSLAVSSQLPGLAGLSGTYTLFFVGAVLVVLAIVLVRLVSARMTSRLLGLPRKDTLALWTVMGRGLAAAVLASLPFTIPEYTSDPPTPYHLVMAPYEAQFLNITFFVIVLTAILTTLGVVFVERRYPTDEARGARLKGEGPAAVPPTTAPSMASPGPPGSPAAIQDFGGPASQRSSPKPYSPMDFGDLYLEVDDEEPHEDALRGARTPLEGEAEPSPAGAVETFQERGPPPTSDPILPEAPPPRPPGSKGPVEGAAPPPNATKGSARKVQVPFRPRPRGK